MPVLPGLIQFTSPKPQTTNFLPRVGFAYSPGESGNTSIRGGFGMAVDVLYDNLGILSPPPQVQQTCESPPGNQERRLLLEPECLPGRRWIALEYSGSVYQRGRCSCGNLGLHSEPVPAVFGDLEPGHPARVRTEVHIGSALRGNPRYSPPDTDPSEPPEPDQPVGVPADLHHGSVTITLNSLPFTLDQISNNPSYVPSYANAGFNGNNVVGFENYGVSNYNGLQTQFTRNFTNGLQFQAAWTWSHAFDNSTADVFSTYLTPRRPQDFQNIASDWSPSALDRRHRITLEAIYDLPFFKNSGWAMKNLVGNWQFAPIYTFESPEYATVQSSVDTNGNGDAAGDRAILNPAGISGTGSDVTPLLNSAGATVAYLAVNPNAQYIVAGPGALANIGRNTLALPHTNNVDMSLVKRVNITERQVIEFQAQAVNLFNHAQYVPGFISDIQAANTAITTAGPTHDFLVPATPPSTNLTWCSPTTRGQWCSH